MSNDVNQNTDFGERVFRQFMELFVTPSIKERQSKGELPKSFPLHAAQIIFFPDDRKPLVRLNEEVQANGKIKSIEMFEKMKLVEDQFQDCGHATLLRFNDIWHIAFDFRYNKELSTNHLDTAVEFYELSEVALGKRHWSAFVDNLFSAYELAAKAILLSTPEKEFREKTTHKHIHSRFNRFARLGNIKEDHKDVFNKLSEMRSNARYLKGELNLSDSEAAQMLSTVKEFIDLAKERTTV